MYAVIEQGSKQYKVAEGDCINIELAEAAPDAETINLDKVLFVNDGEKVHIGTPYVQGAKVVASFKTNAEGAVVKGDKIHTIYFRRHKNSNKRVGHRQKFMQVTISKIEL